MNDDVKDNVDEDAWGSPEAANELEPPKDEASSDGPARSPAMRPRFSMLSLMLFAGVVCVWSMYFQLLRVNPEIRQQNETMRSFSRDLLITDPGRISIARQVLGWYDEAIWKVYIPEGSPYEMHLATREVAMPNRDDPDPPPTVAQMTLQPGSYKIELRSEKTDNGNRVIVLVDDEEMITYDEDKEWYPGHGSSGGAHFDRPQQPEKDDKVILFRRRFMEDVDGRRSRTPDGPTNGLELRLEKKQK